MPVPYCSWFVPHICFFFQFIRSLRLAYQTPISPHLPENIGKTPVFLVPNSKDKMTYTTCRPTTIPKKAHLKISVRDKLSPSSVASPICQEGQNERTFPIFYLFFPNFPDFFLFFPIGKFFAVRGGTLPPLTPQWLRHCYRLWPDILNRLKVQKYNNIYYIFVSYTYRWCYLI